MSATGKDPIHSGLETGRDNIVLPFYAEVAGVNGRVVRLGSVIDDILKQHDYPEPVSQLLGEAIVLTYMMGTSLKFDGRLILQTQTKGIVDLLVVQFTAPGSIRGYARFDSEKISPDDSQNLPVGDLLGEGHMAITIDQGQDMDRYQGIVALEGKSLSDVAHQYFEQSEQLPTLVRLAVAKHYMAGEGDSSGTWQWRAGGLMIQDLTREGGRASGSDEGVNELEKEQVDADGWNRAKHLAETVEDHELLDPMLGTEQLLYRLFHEEMVRVFDARALKNECSCARDAIFNVVKQFGSDDIEEMLEEGKVVVTCEFCSTKYFFSREELGH